MTKELFSNKIQKGRRTYYFDIKKTRTGELYFKISESKITEDGFEHHRMMIFEPDLEDFVAALNKTAAVFKHLKTKRKAHA